MSGKNYDVIVVGSGASGGYAAKELTERGLEVLVLEAGGNSLANLKPAQHHLVHVACGIADGEYNSIRETQRAVVGIDV